MKAKPIFLLLILGSISFGYSCTSNNSHKNQPVNKDTTDSVIKERTVVSNKKDSIKIYGFATEDSITIEKDIDVKKNRYIIEYGNDLNLDTTIVWNDYSIRLICAYDTSRSYILPKKYVWDRELKGVKIYYSQCMVILKSPEKMNIDTIRINENTFSTLLSKDDKQVVDYGVLFGLQIEQVDKVKGILIMDCSYSIPFTDLGVGTRAVIDIKAGKISTSIE